MLSFHQSRGRILFEAFCAFAISASFLGAWTDLGTLAFLPAAAVFAIYGLVRLFDLRKRKPAAVVGMAHAADAGEIQGDLLDYVPVAQTEPVVEVWPVTAGVAAPEPKSSKFVAKKPARARRKKPVAVVPILVKPAEHVPMTVAEPAPESEMVELEQDELAPTEEATHAPVAPLFEAEPFVRQQRAVFGRKAG